MRHDMKNTYFEQTIAIGLLKFEIKFSVITMLIIYLGLFPMETFHTVDENLQKIIKMIQLCKPIVRSHAVSFTIFLS